MNKEKIATIIVENKFREICTNIWEDYNSSKKRRFVKVNFIFYRITIILLFVLTLISIPMSALIIFDFINEASSEFKKFLSSAVMAPMFVIFALLLLWIPYGVPNMFFQLRFGKYPSGKYNFDLFEKYPIDNQKTTTINRVFNLGLENDIEFKVSKGVVEAFNKSYKHRLFASLFVLFESLVIVGFISLMMSKLSMKDEYIMSLIFNVYVGIIVLVTSICLGSCFIAYLKKNRAIKNVKSNGYNPNYYCLRLRGFYDKSYQLLDDRLFSEKSLLMKLVYSHDKSINFIDENNYVDYLGEVAEALAFELAYFDDEYKYLITNDKSTINEFLKEQIDICIMNLSRLKKSELKKLYNETNIDIYTIEENNLLSETMISITSRVTNLFYRLENSIALFKNNITYGYDRRFRYNRVDNRSAYPRYLYKLRYINDTSVWRKFLSLIPSPSFGFNYLKNYQYFQPYFAEGYGYGFVGYDSSCLRVMYNADKEHSLANDNPSLEKFDSSNMYKSYQFVLTSENTLIKRVDYYESEVELKRQLFYQDKLILCETVAMLIKDFCNLEPITVKFGGKMETYYICEPKVYSEKALNPKMSLYFEEFGNRLVKNSCLIEPCIVKRFAEKKKLFGVVSRRVIDYNYFDDYKYSYIIFTEEIYNLLSVFDDLMIIRNERGDGADIRDDIVNTVELSKNSIIDVNYSCDSFEVIRNKDKYSYTTNERNKYLFYNFRLILNVVIIVIVVFVFKLFIDNLLVDIIYNSEYKLSNVRIFRLAILLLPVVLILITFNLRKLILSPISTIKKGEIIHKIWGMPLISGKTKRKHKVLDDDLNMAFHKNKIMFELPIENKDEYIDDELYYNGTSYALNGIEVNMEKAVDKGESFVHEVHNVYYQSNQVWKKIRER